MHVSVGLLLALKFLSFLFPISVWYNSNCNGIIPKISTPPTGHIPDPNYIENEGFSYFDLEYFFPTTWRNSTKITITAKIKRSAAPTILYSNSVLVFHPVIKLVHDIEVNPGPDKPTKERSTSSKNNNNIKIAHLNVRSLKNTGHFIQVKDTIISNNDVFTISETWLDHTVSNLEVEIPGYDIYRIDRQSKRGGGVCAYVWQSFKTEVLNQISGISDTGLHQLWVKIQVRNLRSFLVCTTYRPPGTPTMSFDTDLGGSLISASLLNRPICILGDMNCNLLQPDLLDSQALTNFCHAYNLTQFVTEPTRITDSTV